MNVPKSYQDLPLDQNHQVTNKIVNLAFGELNLTQRNDRIDVVVTLLMRQFGEGWKTGLALDGSASMQGAFGATCEWVRKMTDQEEEKFVREGKG
jgi:hypothetical protein